MEEDKFIGKLHFSFADEYETTTFEKEYNEEPDDFETIWWFTEEFKNFLGAMGFSNTLIDRVVCLDPGEKVIDQDGAVLTECKIIK